MQSRHTYENEILILKLQNLIHRLSSVKHCSNERYLKRMQSVGYGPALGAVSFEAVVGLRTSSDLYLLVTHWIVLLRRSSFVLGGIRTSVFSRCVHSGFVPRSIVSEFIYRTGAGAVVLIWCVLSGFVPRSIVSEFIYRTGAGAVVLIWCVLSGFVPRSIVWEFIYRTGAGAVVLIWCVLLGCVPRSFDEFIYMMMMGAGAVVLIWCVHSGCVPRSFD